MKLDREFKFRISSAMLATLERAAAARGEGSKIADLIREAITNVYLKGYDIPDAGSSMIAEEPARPQKPTKKKRRKDGDDTKKNN